MIEGKNARAIDLGSWLIASEVAKQLGPRFTLSWEAFAGMYDELVFRAPPHEWVSLNRNGRLHAQRPDGERIALSDADVWTRVAAARSNPQTIADIVAAVVGVYDGHPMECARSVELIAEILQHGQHTRRRYRAESLQTASISEVTFPTVQCSGGLRPETRSQMFLIRDHTTPLLVVDLNGPMHAPCASTHLLEQCHGHYFDVRDPSLRNLSAMELRDFALSIPACQTSDA